MNWKGFVWREPECEAFCENCLNEGSVETLLRMDVYESD